MPHTILREAQDMGPCDFSEVLSAAHMLDDQIVAATPRRLAGLSSLRLSKSYLHSATHLRDCLNTYNQCNGTSFHSAMHYLRKGWTKSEANAPFSRKPGECTRGVYLSRYPNRLTKGRLDLKCFDPYDYERIQRELEEFGPFAHDFIMHDNLFNCHDHEGFITNDTECYNTRLNVSLGYTSVIVAGYETTSENVFLHIKFHFGNKFGTNGFLKIDTRLLGERFFPECDYDGNSLWRGSLPSSTKFPFLHFTLSMRGIPNKLKNQVNARLINRPANPYVFLEPMIIGRRSKFILGQREGKTHLPYIHFALRAIMQEDVPNLKVLQNSTYCYNVQRIVHADMVVVSGKKIFVVLELRRMKRKYGCKNLEFEETIDAKNGYLPEVIYYSSEVWMPHYASETDKYKVKSMRADNSAPFREPRVKFVVINQQVIISGKQIFGMGMLTISWYFFLLFLAITFFFWALAVEQPIQKLVILFVALASIIAQLL